MNWRRSDIPPLSETQFRSWQSLLEERTVMYIPFERRSLLQSSLALRMREIDCICYEEYLAKVKEKPGGVLEWSTLIARLTGSRNALLPK